MLVDTSVLIRTLQPHHSLYIYADRAIRLLPEQGMKLHIVAQNLIELWTSSVPMATSVGVQDAYFGRHRLSPLDRVGSAATVGSQNVSFYPYGEDKGTAGANDNWKFGTYLRDSATGLDYAMNRYYSSGLGRFLTPDSFWRSARLGTPQSWNRYAYAANDPINRNDPTGKCSVVAGGITEGTLSDPGLNQLATDVGAISAYAYGNTTSSNQGVNILQSIVEVGLAAAGPTPSVAAVAAAILAAAQNPGPIDIFAFSGGAQDVATALNNLPASIVSRIRNIVYIDRVPWELSNGIGNHDCHSGRWLNQLGHLAVRIHRND
jgi:RHS repeat-associated protein